MLLDLLFLIWCFPQNTLSSLTYQFLESQEKVIETFQYEDAEAVVLEGDDFFAYTYGEKIFLSEKYLEDRKEATLAHEYGHVIQSRRQGPLHALLVGLPSWYHQYRSPLDREWADRYYERWPEAAADRLGGAEEFRESSAWRRPPWYEDHPETVLLQETLYPKHSWHFFSAFSRGSLGNQHEFTLEYIPKSTSLSPFRPGFSLSCIYHPQEVFHFSFSPELVCYSSKSTSGLFGTAGLVYTPETGETADSLSAVSSAAPSSAALTPTASAGLRFHSGIWNQGFRLRLTWENFDVHAFLGSSAFEQLRSFSTSSRYEIGVSL